MKIFLVLFSIVVIISCNKTEKNQTLGPQNLVSEYFSVDPTKDTILMTTAGSKISVLAGTFENKGPVNIEVKEALNISDIVLARLTTSSDSLPLKTDGMVFINGIQNGTTTKILKPIEISIPTNYYDPEMKVFSGEVGKDSSINWKNPEMPLNRNETKLVDSGKLIFQRTCAACHSITRPISGPALAFVTDRRCMEWLKKATRNPMQLLMEDECFRAQQKKYGGMIMPPIQLSDAQIESVYAYIKEESEKLKLPGTTIDIFDPCRNLIINDTTEVLKHLKKKSSKKLTSVSDSYDSFNVQNFNPTIPSKDETLPKEFNVFTIQTFGWYNIDIYAGTDPAFVEGKMFLKINGARTSNLTVFLVIPSKRICVHGVENTDGKYYFFYQNNGYVKWPLNKTAFLLAVENVEKPSFGKLEFKTARDLELTLDMVPNSNIVNEIKSMNLNQFKFEPTQYKIEPTAQTKPEKRILITQRIYKFECSKKSDTTAKQAQQIFFRDVEQHSKQK